jgi:hypothetical protein
MPLLRRNCFRTLAVLVALATPFSIPVWGQAKSAAKSATVAKPGLPDAAIEAEIHKRLARSIIGKDGFTAQVKGGIAYWQGTTSVPQHKGAATRMAKSSGARHVINNIQVNGAKGKHTAAVREPAANPASLVPATNTAVLKPTQVQSSVQAPVQAPVQAKAATSAPPAAVSAGGHAPAPKPQAATAPSASDSRKVTVQWRSARQ